MCFMSFNLNKREGTRVSQVGEGVTPATSRLIYLGLYLTFSSGDNSAF